MIDRLMRAIRLDRTLYRQVADNPEFTNEAVLVAIIVSLVASLSALFGANHSFLLFLGQLFNNLIFGWVLWAVIAYFVGSTFFHGRSSVTEMLRTLAYAGAPRLLGVFGFIPCVGWILALVGWLLSIIAGVIAIRESMEFDTTSAVITAVIGFVLYLIASVILGLLLSPFALLGK